jgi:hypothetical protein
MHIFGDLVRLDWLGDISYGIALKGKRVRTIS